MHSRDVPIAAEQLALLPPQVQQLAGRERELASKIYLHGPMTAEALGNLLPTPLSNSAIRTMLARLCDKGILGRRKLNASASAGRRVPFVYLPAISAELAKRRALEQLAADYFDGSLLVVLHTAIDLLASGDQALAARTPVLAKPPALRPSKINLAA
jgi:predicted transcriptional regulator